MFPNAAQLKSMKPAELETLAHDLRDRIIQTTARQGGHLAASLGTVELCIALHRVFDIPTQDTLFFDVGHQAYAHKLLTGREELFEELRSAGGCSGFPSPDENAADPLYAGHAGVAISQAAGDAAARRHTGQQGKAIAVIGDGAMSCGIAWEAINNISDEDGNLLIVLNDNQMSISPAHGALRRCLNRVISGRFYNRVRNALKVGLGARHSKRLHRFWRRIEDSLKRIFIPKGVLFQELGLRYLGPIDGNCLKELQQFLRLAREERHSPVLLHIVTRKGKGCPYAEAHPELYHGVSSFDPDTGNFPRRDAAETPAFSKIFGETACMLAQALPSLAVISAAMLDGTGLNAFAKQFPKRCYDVGIAEEHAIAFAAGLARGGMQPIVALYSTFLQRALDNLYHDICLNRLPVILAIDRAGAVTDGPTHHGIYDLGFLREMPNLTVLVPSDGTEMVRMLGFACALKAPVAIRYPRGAAEELPVDSEPVVLGKARLIRNPAEPTLALWGLGSECVTALKAAEIIEKQSPGQRVAVIDARFISPFDIEMAQRFAKIPQATIEDHCLTGGLADCVAAALSNTAHAKLHAFGWPAKTVIPHGTAAELRRQFRLTPEAIAAELLG